MGILVHGIDIFIPEMVYINTVASETRLFKNIIQRTLESCIYKQQENTYSWKQLANTEAQAIAGGIQESLVPRLKL